MSTRDRKAQAVDEALSRMRLLALVDCARLKAQAHRLTTHGLDDAARLIGQHATDLEAVTQALDEAVAQLLAVVDPAQEDTAPMGLPLPRE